MENLESLKASSKVLGNLFYYNIVSDKLEQVINIISNEDAILNWPYGNESELSEISSLLKKGLEDKKALDEEYKKLFVGPHKLSAPPWGSVYLDKEAVIFGESTIELRIWLKSIGVEPVLEQKEPEDHIGLMLMLTSFIAEKHRDKLKEYFENHLYTWCYRYLEVFDSATSNPFYKGLHKLTLLTLKSWQQEYNISLKEVKYYF